MDKEISQIGHFTFKSGILIQHPNGVAQPQGMGKEKGDARGDVGKQRPLRKKGNTNGRQDGTSKYRNFILFQSPNAGQQNQGSNCSQ